MLEGGYGDKELLEQHRRIYDAIASGDPVAAHKTMESHMNLVVDYYLKAAD